jgi:hypothetical protein
MKLHMILFFLVFGYALINRTIDIFRAIKAADYSKLKFQLFFTGLILAVGFGLLYVEYVWLS